jgi:ABC-type molybdate transport system substrate-binding protein
MGFEAISGDHWEEKPTILLFSGGVNRMAVEKTIQEFEIREGVDVERVYNGCGILVSQINSGQRPDAYLTCDISFMDQVQDKFMDITDISNTKILIAVKKDNPKGVKDLNDLTESDIRIGVCNPEQSALGALTKRLLEPSGIWEKIQPNIYVQTPTADLLVNQLRTGSLDAVIVYEANISQVRDKLTIISIDDPHAMAFQNYGIGENSEYYWLLSRLLKSITSDASKENFLTHGFSWEYKGNDDL